MVQNIKHHIQLLIQQAKSLSLDIYDLGSFKEVHFPKY